MSRLLQHFIEKPRECSYLPDRLASLENKIMLDVSPAELESMLERGWRRFGPIYFRPACEGCMECVSIRIPTATFEPTESQRRARRRLNRFRIEVGPPALDAQRLALYRAWHAQREEVREWAPSPLDAREYHLQFAFPHPSAREVTYWDGETLVGLGTCDETPHAWSAVYFFYSPKIARLSPGIGNVVFQVEHARAKGIPHLYLGYRVLECPSMRYKAGFKPHELLDTRPAPDKPPAWR